MKDTLKLQQKIFYKNVGTVIFLGCQNCSGQPNFERKMSQKVFFFTMIPSKFPARETQQRT